MNKITFIIEPYRKYGKGIWFKFGVIISNKPVLEIDTHDKSIIEKELRRWEDYRLNHYGFDLIRGIIDVNKEVSRD